jgi:sugar phosphate isomerase/epimerase
VTGVPAGSPRVYASTACVSAPRDLWAILSAYRTSGLERVELGACTVEDDASPLAARLRGEGLDYLVHNYFPPPPSTFVLNLASPDPQLRSRSLQFVLAAISLAAEIGSSLYSVHAGFVTDPVGFDGAHFVLPAPQSAQEADRASERLAEGLQVAVERAHELGVRLAVENLDVLESDVGRIVPAAPEEFGRLLAEIDGLGLLLDTGHLNVTARTLGFDRATFVDEVAPYVSAFHVHDNHGLADTHLPVSDGSWVLEVLRRPRFAGLPLSVEARFDTAAELAAHVEWLRVELEPPVK